MPGVSGETVVTTLVCFLFCMRGCGRVERPAFPAPSEFQMRFTRCQNSRAPRGENVEVCVCFIPPPRSGGVETSEARSWVAHRERSERCDGWGAVSASEAFAHLRGLPHPALRATLPTKGHKRGRDKKDQACARNEARSPDERSEIRGVCPPSFPDIATTGSERDTYCPRNRCNDDVVELIQKHCSSWRPRTCRRIRRARPWRGR